MPNIPSHLPDGSGRTVAQGATVLEVAEQISPGLARAALVAKLDGALVDLATELTADADLQLLTDRDPKRSRSIAILGAPARRRNARTLPGNQARHRPADRTGLFLRHV